MYLHDPDIKYNRNFIAFVMRRFINEAIIYPRIIYTHFNRCSTVHFDKYEIFLVQQMQYLLKYKIIQFVFKCLNVHFSAPTCFGPLGPSSGSIHQSLAKVTKITFF
jgi:hypothetical protein